MVQILGHFLASFGIWGPKFGSKNDPKNDDFTGFSVFRGRKNSTTEAGGFPPQTLLKFLGPKIGLF